MTNRATSAPSEEGVPPRLTGGIPEEGNITGWPARADNAVRFLPGSNPDEPSRRRLDLLPGILRPEHGDLLAGVVAVVALLVMVALDVTSWLAVPLAVVTYFAITLLRPPLRGRLEQAVEETSSQDAQTQETGGEVDAEPHIPDRGSNGVESIATSYGLTRREREILPLLAQRLTDREIADHLSISHRTAMNHTANILGKLGLASRRDVADFVARHNSLPPSAASKTPE